MTHQTYKKTAKGIAELGGHDLRLRPELRRLLILIDGVRSVDSLSRMFRANELPALLDELAMVGAIELVDAAVSYVPQGAEQGKAGDSAELDIARRTAESAAKALLGRSADSLVEAIRKSRDWQSFRVAVSEVQLRLIGQHGEDAATQYVVAIRDAVRTVSSQARKPE